MTVPHDESRSVSVTRGRWLLVAAALLWSTTGLFVKAAALREIPGPTLACLRALFAAACLVPFVRIASIRFRPRLVSQARRLERNTVQRRVPFLGLVVNRERLDDATRTFEFGGYQHRGACAAAIFRWWWVSLHFNPRAGYCYCYSHTYSHSSCPCSFGCNRIYGPRIT